ncbi:MAG: biotin/lipoyl-containing protein, partial [Sphingomonadales bacterium]
MPITIAMPALSPTMEVGTLAKWHVAVGATVKSGDIIAEIETDKATMEVEAVDEGTVTALLVAEGAENVAVGTPIMTLAGEDEASSPLPQAGGAGGGAVPPASPIAVETPPSPGSAAPSPTSPPRVEVKAGDRVGASPLARRLS